MWHQIKKQNLPCRVVSSFFSQIFREIPLNQILSVKPYLIVYIRIGFEIFEKLEKKLLLYFDIGVTRRF